VNLAPLINDATSTWSHHSAVVDTGGNTCDIPAFEQGRVHPMRIGILGDVQFFCQCILYIFPPTIYVPELARRYVVGLACCYAGYSSVMKKIRWYFHKNMCWCRAETRCAAINRTVSAEPQATLFGDD